MAKSWVYRSRTLNDIDRTCSTACGIATLLSGIGVLAFVDLSFEALLFNLIYTLIVSATFFLNRDRSVLKLGFYFLFTLYFVLPEPILLKYYLDGGEPGFGIGGEFPELFVVSEDIILAKLLLLMFFLSVVFGLRLGNIRVTSIDTIFE